MAGLETNPDKSGKTGIKLMHFEVFSSAGACHFFKKVIRLKRTTTLFDVAFFNANGHSMNIFYGHKLPKIAFSLNAKL